MTNIFGASRDKSGKRPRLFIKPDAAQVTMYQAPLSSANELLVLAQTIRVKFPGCASLDCGSIEKLLKYYPTGVDYVYLLPPIAKVQDGIIRIISSLSPDNLQELTKLIIDKKLSVKSPELHKHFKALIDMLSNVLNENSFTEDLQHRIKQQQTLLMLGLGYDPRIIDEVLSAAA